MKEPEQPGSMSGAAPDGVGDGDGEVLDAASARRLAAGVTQLVDAARWRVQREGSDLVARVAGHVGVELSAMPTVSLSFPGWEHANLQRGSEAYLAEHSPQADWFGVAGGYQAMGMGLGDLLTMAASHGMFRLGAVTYTTVAVGPDEVTEAVKLGFVATYAPTGAPVVFGLRGPQENAAQSLCLVEVFAARRADAVAARDAFERHVRDRDVHRGAVLSFDVADQRGNELVTFLPRPQLDSTQVVLPAGVLAAIEAHVVRSAAHTARLQAWGQHLKRGILLHGPPGTGKTHTVRYLLSRLTGTEAGGTDARDTDRAADVTAAVLSGRALAQSSVLTAAITLVRRLQPAVLILEDVDLIAEDRAGARHGSNQGATPLLFELLNRIDGLDPDADVTFILTTNRVETLERALADRPGRVDLAVEVPRPDAAAREALLRLYAGPVPLDLPDPTGLITATDGVTASFIREWVRRSLSAQLTNAEHHPRLDEPALRATLDDLTQERHHLTAHLLGQPAEPASG